MISGLEHKSLVFERVLFHSRDFPSVEGKAVFMKAVPLYLGVLCACFPMLTTTLAQQPQVFPKGTHPVIVAHTFRGNFDVPVRSKGNSLVISISNPIEPTKAPMAMDSVMVWVKWPFQQPPPGWPEPTMNITPVSQSVSCPSVGKQSQAVFRFDVPSRVQPGDLDSLRIGIVGRTGSLLDEVAAIHFVDGTQSVTITIP